MVVLFKLSKKKKLWITVNDINQARRVNSVLIIKILIVPGCSSIFVLNLEIFYYNYNCSVEKQLLVGSSPVLELRQI